MARTVEEILKMQLGSLLMEIAVLTSQLETEREKATEVPASEEQKEK